MLKKVMFAIYINQHCSAVPSGADSNQIHHGSTITTSVLPAGNHLHHPSSKCIYSCSGCPWLSIYQGIERYDSWRSCTNIPWILDTHLDSPLQILEKCLLSYSRKMAWKWLFLDHFSWKIGIKPPIFKIFKKAFLALFPYMVGTSGPNFS